VGEPFALDEIPKHEGSVTRSGSHEGGSVDHVESVNLSLVSSEGVHQVHVEVVPNLDGLIPGSGDADCWLLGVVESNARHGISVLVFVNSVFAFGTGVPDFDIVVGTSSNDLSVINGKGNGENLFGVTNKLANGFAGGNVPEADSSIPGGRESKTRVTSEANFADEMGVTSEKFLWLSPFSVFIFILFVIEFPLNEGLVTGSGHQEFLSLSINLLVTNSEGSDPATMALEISLVFEYVFCLSLLSH